MSLLVNTPDSYNQLVRSALRAWTVFRLTCSLHSVHCSLLPEQGKSVEVYLTSEHSLMDLRCATSSRTDECDIIYVCKYIQFKFTSRTLQFTMNGIRSLWTGIMEEYRVMSRTGIENRWSKVSKAAVKSASLRQPFSRSQYLTKYNLLKSFRAVCALRDLWYLCAIMCVCASVKAA